MSSASSGPINSGSQPIRATNARKTPAQVKAEAAARRAKVMQRVVYFFQLIAFGRAEGNFVKFIYDLNCRGLGGGYIL